ncbi:hypothetical protein J2R95_003177 [Bradyrhizobium japonicum]|uniref:hypothetical protein n=1 Tax=Bradyrhizobium japonicum TaxID=375 RepID=UPI00209F99D5|nr:hypothetical protein [Bradyrhizobium japonicum]MCP1937382.1 hypothetical protein [Bradyrhizobium japonicum]
MSFVIGLLTQLLPGLFGWLNKKEDTRVVEINNSATVSTALVANDTSRIAAVRDVTLAMMNHPVFWVAWGLGVFPVLTYHATIFLVSTFPHLWLWSTGIPANKAVLEVPAAQMEYARLVVGSVFTLTGVSTVVAGIASAWIRRA